ncbi:interleukin-18 receptor accessory protein [Microcaecilia unicolor]|uniref:Interleukin-18 receptor accessory protein n=1 Tax=Microcaecilia unicolor TaxID=1415580 RepID=A0A6P7XY78_9AMPH|nr:interleukin-18 receptor accessory protein [Microcaecilia unicolor]
MKKELLIAHCFFILAIAGTKFTESALAGCSDGKPHLKYRALNEEQFYLQCILPQSSVQSSGYIFNQSTYNQVKWFRQHENKKLIELDNSSNDPNTLWFSPARIGDSGTYICSLRQENVCVKIILEVQAKEDANCSDYRSSDLFLFIGTGREISCPAASCDNGLWRSAEHVTWYKDNKRFIPLPPRSVIKHNRIKILKIFKYDEGIYACDYVQCDDTSLCETNSKWIRRAVFKVCTIVDDTKYPPNILDPPGDKTLEVKLGKPLEIKCKVLFGFEKNFFPQIQWLRKNRDSKSGQLEQNSSILGVKRSWEQCKKIKVDEPNNLYGITYHHVAKLNEVTEEDLHDIFICHATNSVGNSTAVLKLKEKKTDQVYFVYVLSITVVLLLVVLGGSGFVYVYWIEVVLVYRNYFSKDETLRDHKEFDAFVSYAKQGSFDYSDKEKESYFEEERFAVEYLPEVLEKVYGYKLCLIERDILPGGAYIEDIVKYIKRCRRAIFILSPRYINGPSIFELETAIKCTIEDNKLKLILIKYKTFQEPNSLPPIVKKALTVLPVVSWKAKSVSATYPSYRFWNKIQYHMPVKKTKSWKESSKIWFNGIVIKEHEHFRK